MATMCNNAGPAGHGLERQRRDPDPTNMLRNKREVTKTYAEPVV
jgi:hypothetical protein